MPTLKTSILRFVPALALVLAACGSSKQSAPSTAPPSALAKEQEVRHQTPPPEPAQPETELERTDGTAAPLSEEKVETFARAFLQVMNIQQEFDAKMQSASSPSEVESLQLEGQKRAEQAVTEQGMSVEEFKEIGQALGTDTELRQRVEAKIQELQNETAPHHEGTVQ